MLPDTVCRLTYRIIVLLLVCAIFAGTALALDAVVPTVRTASQIIHGSDDGIATGDYYGESIAISGDWAVVGGPADSLIDRNGAVYFWKRTGSQWALKQKIARPDGNAQALNFGSVVSMRADVAVVGAPNSATEAVFVFRRTGDTWNLEQTIPSPSGAANRGFGAAVSVYDDRLLVGMPNQLSSGGGVVGAGCARFYRRVEGTWTFEREFVAAAPSQNAHFGYSVCQGPDIVMVSEPKDSDFSSSRGQVFVYTLASDDVTWQAPQALFDSTNTTSRDRFGISMSLDGDQLLVGASNSSGGGRAFVFQRSGDVWALDSKWTSTVSSPAEFGRKVGLSAGTAVVISRGQYDNRLKLGAQIFTRLGPGNWSSGAVVPFSQDTGVASIAIEGSSAILGHVRYDGNTYLGFGAASALSKSGSNWSIAQTMDPPLTVRAEDDGFGRHISSDGATVIIPSQHDGSVILSLYRRDDNGLWQLDGVIENRDLANSGLRLAISGDVAVASQPDVAKVFIYQREAAGKWNLAKTLDGATEGAYVKFGEQTALHGATLLVTGRRAAPSAIRKVLAFVRTGDQWTAQGELFAGDNQLPAEFGYSIALQGNEALVGAPSFTSSGAKGAVYSFRRTNGQWRQTAKLPLPSWTDLSGFGVQILMDGDTALFGANNSRWPITVYRQVSGVWKVESNLNFPEPLPFGWETAPADPVTLRNGCVALSLSVGEGYSVHRFTRQGKVWKWSGQYDSSKDLARIEENQFDGAVELTADALFIGDSKHQGGDYGCVHVFPLAEMILTEGPAAGLEIGGSTLAFGDVLTGKSSTRTVSLTNYGTVPLAPQWSAITGSGSAAYQAGAFSPASIAPGQTGTAVISFSPLAATPYAASATVTTGVARGRVHNIQFSGRGAAVQALGTIAMPESKFLVLGQKSAALIAEVSATEPNSLQWLKDGKEVKGATSRTLVLPAVLPTDAGTYQLRVRQTEPISEQLSDPCKIGVYAKDLLVRRTTKDAQVTAQAWGPDLAFEWLGLEWPILQDNLMIDGRSGPTVRFRQLPRGEVALFATIKMGGLSVSAAGAFKGDMRPLPPTSPFAFPIEMPVGVPVALPIYYLEPGTKMHASGLPPGLKLEPATGFLYGTPSKAGDFSPLFWFSNAYGSSEKTRGFIMTYPGYAVYEPGTYAGAFPQDTLWTQELGGWGQTVLLPSGAFTLNLRLGQQNFRLAGALTYTSNTLGYPEFSATLRLPNDPDRVVHLRLENATLYLTFESPQGNLETSLRRAWNDGRGEVSTEGRVQNVIFGFDGVMGDGYGSLTISASGQTKFAGALPDGTSLTFASILDVDGLVPFHVLTANGLDSLVGQFGTAAYGGSIYVRGEGTGNWNRKPQIRRAFEPAGFSVPFSITACRYFPPMPNQMLMPGLASHPDNVTLSLSSSLVAEIAQPFQLTAKHVAQFAAAGSDSNPQKVRLVLYPATGLFTGNFTVVTGAHPVTAAPITKELKFQGMLLPEVYTGHGYFLQSVPNPEAGGSTVSSGRAGLQALWPF